MSIPIFVTGIGTDVGKTLAAAIVTEALGAGYWKPVQAGSPTDSDWVRERLSDPIVYPERYVLKLPASPHIAAREENIDISLADLAASFKALPGKSPYTVVEGAGGLLVPLNDRDTMSDLALTLGARVILVSRHYLGSINHSLLTAEVCRTRGLDVLGWIFNDRYLDYEEEIVGWSGYRRIGSIPFTNDPGPDFVRVEAARLRPCLVKLLDQ